MNKTPLRDFLKRLAEERPKPFPEWNSFEDFELPVGPQLFIAQSNGKVSFYNGFSTLPRDASHWMYAPNPPEPEPKRGMWVSIADGLPPIGMQVLVKGQWFNNFRQASLAENHKWVLASTDYEEIPDKVISHWYLPHEFKA